MFGYFRIDPAANLQIKNVYKKYYCLLCRTLQKEYGMKARLLLSYDVTFLLLLFADKDYACRCSNVSCFRNHPGLSETIAAKASKSAADLGVLLFAAKMEDDILDDKSTKAKLMTLIYSIEIKRAKSRAPQLWDIIQSEYAELRGLEKNNADLETMELKFSQMMQRIGKEVFSLEDKSRLDMLDFAARWLYFIDAVDDLDKNRMDGSFNPLLHYESFSNLKCRNYLFFGQHFQTLFSKVEPLKDNGDSSLVLNRLVYFTVPYQTLKVFGKRGQENEPLH